MTIERAQRSPQKATPNATAAPAPSAVRRPDGNVAAERRPPANASADVAPRQDATRDESARSTQLADTVGPGKPRVKTATGADALRALAVIPSQQPITVSAGAMGNVTLVPGANIDDKILVSASPYTVYYIDGVDLWKAYTPDFVRNFWITSLAKGVQSAQWLVPIIAAQMAFLQAFVAPIWLLAGMSILKGIAFYDRFKAQLHAALANVATFYQLRTELKMRFPTLYEKVMQNALAAALAHAAEGITLEDLAYLLGRIVGTKGLLGAHEAGLEMSLKLIAKVVVLNIGVMAVLRGPKFVVLGLEGAVASSAKELQKELAQMGIKVSEDDAKKIVRELVADPNAKEFLDKFKISAEQLQKSVKSLSEVQ